jgi:hypothetical protein
VQPDVTGFVANNEAEFASAVANLYFNREKRGQMSQRAREAAAKHSWDAVFGEVYTHYEAAFTRRAPAAARSLTFA